MKISFIISDQTMTYMDGTSTVKALKELSNYQMFTHIPFYILTAYEDEKTVGKIKSVPITNIFTKPMKKSIIEKIIGDINK